MSGRRATPRPRTRTLLFLALCFAASAGVRVGEVGYVAAQGLADGPPEPTALPLAAPAPETGDLSRQAAVCEAEPGTLLAAIRDRAAALDAREARIAERESLLEVAEKRIREELDTLRAAEEQLAATLALADGASERDVAHLVGVYETMKSKNAAQIFSAMDPDFAAGFLARMRPDAAAGILGDMEAQAAYAVSVVMAGRHVGASGQ